MSTYEQLERQFTEQRIAFKAFEVQYQQTGNDKNADQLDRDITVFSKWLETFTKLHYDMSLEGGLKNNSTEHHRRDMEGLTMIINKIQFIYITQLNQKLNTINNRTNLRIAIGAILCGLVCTIGSLVYAHYDSKQGQDDILAKLKTTGQDIVKVRKQDSLIIKELKTDSVYSNIKSKVSDNRHR